MIEDAEGPWLFESDRFDFIHARNLDLSIRDWPEFIRQSMIATTPGGHIELCAKYPRPFLDGCTLEFNSAYKRLSQKYIDIGTDLGTDPDAPLKFKKWLEDAGYIEVKETVYKIPCSPWSSDPFLREIGRLELLNTYEGAWAALEYGWKHSLHLPDRKLKSSIREALEELMTCKIKQHVLL
jgi:hypothetical protein